MGQEEHGGDDAADGLQGQTAAHGQGAEVIGEAERAQEPDSGREGGTRAVARQGRGCQQADSDRQAAAPGGRHDV